MAKIAIKRVPYITIGVRPEVYEGIVQIALEKQQTLSETLKQIIEEYRRMSGGK